MELSSVRTGKEPFFSGAVMPPEGVFSYAAGQPRQEQQPVRRRVHFASAVDSCAGRCEFTNCLDGTDCVSCLGARIPGGSRRKAPPETGKDGGEAKRRRVEQSSGDHREQDNGKNSSPPEPPKDYVHVRARRGQATDSHSLAERVRRERISERMKLLQGLVPGCDKITSRALVLDEIINYVQSLQQQIEFLSTKLAALNPQFNLAMATLLDQNIDQGDAYPRMQLECPYLDGFTDALLSQVGDSWDDELQTVVQNWKKNSY